jgi:hypothetical protein
VSSYGEAAMSDGDGMNSITQVLVVKCVWVPVAMSHHTRHSVTLFVEDSAPAALPGTKNPLGMTIGGALRFELGHVEDLQWADRW